MWATLPESVDRSAILFIGGSRFNDTIKLRSVSSQFRRLVNDVIEDHISDENAEVRMEALLAHIHEGEQGSARALQCILTRATDDEAPIRRLAVTTLGYLVSKDDEEGPAAVDAALRLLDDSDSSVRQAARSLLSTVAEKSEQRVVVALAAIAGSSKVDTLIRQEAVEALGAMALRGDPHAVAAVFQSIDDPQLAVRREAVATLGDVAAYRDLEGTALLCHCCADPDPTVRCALAHASAIVAPWGHQEMVRALASLLEDSHAEVRARALFALGSLADPADLATTTAVSSCARDADERVRGAATKALMMLAPATFSRMPSFSFPQPFAIEGVKSKKAVLLRVQENLLLSLLGTVSTSLVLSRAARVVLAGPADAKKALAVTLLAGQVADEASVWRHPKAMIACVAKDSVHQLSDQHARRTPTEYLANLVAVVAKDSVHQLSDEYARTTPLKYLSSSRMTRPATAEEVAAHLGRFGLEAVDLTLTIGELPRCKRAFLALSAAFWPKPPHVVVLDEPTAWGLGDHALEALLTALQSYAGGVVLATENASLVESMANKQWLIHGAKS